LDFAGGDPSTIRSARQRDLMVAAMALALALMTVMSQEQWQLSNPHGGR
jgi:hypothetical protein